jgi:hypothetical protein
VLLPPRKFFSTGLRRTTTFGFTALRNGMRMFRFHRYRGKAVDVLRLAKLRVMSEKPKGPSFALMLTLAAIAFLIAVAIAYKIVATYVHH